MPSRSLVAPTWMWAAVLTSFVVLAANAPGGEVVPVVASAAVAAAPEGPLGALEEPPSDVVRGGLLPDGRVAVLVELQAEPAVASWARAQRVTRALSDRAPVEAFRRQIDVVEGAQRELLPFLEDRTIGARVLFRVQRTLNGIAAELDPAVLDVVRALPGVKVIHPLVPVSPLLTTAVPLVGAPQVWNPGGLNVAGDGVRIGIIDTGIDYLHTDFGGPGTGYGANNPNIVGDVAGFPGARVVGGWDFVGETYDATNEDPERRIPYPDPDPVDCGGHGTSVAAIAAGSGVTSTGATFAGPYGPGIPFSSLRIGPGVAPKASLYALKVFGCSGTTMMVVPALDWAVDPNGDGDPSDHLDVVNASIGAAWAYPADDPVSIATENAVRAGVVVVFGANNDGDSYYVTSALGDGVVAVAASYKAGWVVDGVQVDRPAAIAGRYPAYAATRFDWQAMAAPVQGELVVPASPASGCDAFSAADAALLAGKVALLDQSVGGCSSAVRANNAAAAGARGAVMTYPGMFADFSFSGNDKIPLVVVEKPTGDLLRANLSAGIAVTFSKDLLLCCPASNPAIEDQVAAYSARGPRPGDSALRPDVTAPGPLTLPAKSGSGDGGGRFGGTSAASPMVAGALALLRQLHPTWSVAELKALLMNTASHDLFVGANRTPPRHGLARVGAGRIDVANAAASQLIAFDADRSELVSVSFGNLEVVGSVTVERRVTVVNRGQTAATLAIAYDAVTDIPGVGVSFPGGSSITVPAGGSATFTVRLDAEAAAMKHSRDPSTGATHSGYPRYWISEEGGYLVLTPASGPTLRVPLYALARPASSMTASPSPLVMGAERGTLTLTLTGSGVDTGSDYPTDVVSMVNVFELQGESPADPSLSGSTGSSDLRYVGVASSYPARVAEGKGWTEAMVSFALVSQTPWTTPNSLFVSVYVDTNRDGVYDHRVFPAWAGTAGGAANANPSDVLVAWTCPNGSGSCSAWYLNYWRSDVYDTMPFNTNVMNLPVSASALGLGDGHSTFDYWVASWGTEPRGGRLDLSEVMTFDAAHPGVDARWATYWDKPGSTIPIDYDHNGFAANRSRGVLLLHYHNASDTKAEVIPVSPGPCTIGCSTKVAATSPAGSPVTFEATASAANCSSAVSYGWDFGDGSPHATTASATHAFGEAGRYRWRLTVTASAATCTRTGIIEVSPSPAPSTQELWIPVASRVAGANKSEWRTDVAILNVGSLSASVTLVFHGAGGSKTTVRAVPPGGQMVLVDVVGQLGTSGSGALQVLSDRAVRVTSRTYNQATNGTLGQDYLAFVPPRGLIAGQTAVLPQLTENPAFRTNIGLTNTSTEPATVDVTLHDGTGRKLAEYTVELQPGQWQQENRPFATRAGTTSLTSGYALVTVIAGSGVLANASVVDWGTNDPTTIPMIRPQATVGAAGLGDEREGTGASSGVARPFPPAPATASVSRVQRPVLAREGAATSTVAILDEGFEGTFPGNGWTVRFGRTPTGWGTSSYRAAEGTKSLFCAGGGSQPAPPGGIYFSDMDTMAVYGPFSLTDATAAKATFRIWHMIEAPYGSTYYDYVAWVVSPTGGPTPGDWQGFMTAGDSGGWKAEEFAFPQGVLGQPQVYFGLIFHSDEDRVSKGAYVDAVHIEKTIASSCTVSCDATVPTRGAVGAALSFVGTVTPSGCTGSPTFDWGFGDGTTHATGATVSHAYASAGTFNWTMTASVDGVSCQRTGSIIVTTCSLGCTATVPASARAGDAVQFQGSATPSNCSGSPAFDWDFGDGSAHSTSQNASHAYAAPGQYGWRMISSLAGVSCSKTGTITVEAAACTLACRASAPAAGKVGVPVTLTSQVTAPGCGEVNYDWDFGDGRPHSDAAAVTHTYLSAGTYSWVLTAAAAGQECRASGTIAIGETGASFPYTVWVPVASHAGGFNNSQWRTAVAVLNLADLSTAVEVRLFTTSGVRSTVSTVAAGAQIILDDVVGTLGFNGSGALEVRSEVPVVVTSRTYNQATGGTFGQDYATALRSDGLKTGEVAYLLQLAEDAAYRSNIGLVNTAAESARVEISLFDGAGSALTSFTVELAPGQWRQENRPFAVRASRRDIASGYARVTVLSGEGVIAVASVVDAGTNDPTTIGMLR